MKIDLEDSYLYIFNQQKTFKARNITKNFLKI